MKNPRINTVGMIATTLVLVVAGVMTIGSTQASLLLYEPFSTTTYPTDDTKLGRVSGQWNLGNNTDVNDGWSMVRSTAALSYSSLVTSNGSRGVARLANTYAANRNIGAPWTTAVTAGSVYCSFLVNVTTAPTTNRALLVLSYFGSGKLEGRNDGCNAVAWLNASRQLQVGKYSTSAVAAGTSDALQIGTIYLVVLKYTFNPGAGDDEVALYLNPPIAVEPGAPTVSTVSGTDASQIKSVWLPQGQAPEFGSSSGDINLDEIRVGDAWAEVLPSDGSAPISAPVFTQATLVGTNLVLLGTNGPANGTYRMLRSSEAGAPLAAWTGIGPRYFDAGGNFSFTNGLMGGDPAGYFRVQVLASGPVTGPCITGQPQDLAVGIGQNAAFNVTASGTAPLTYAWYFNTNTLLASGPSATLTITNAQLADAGKYSVSVSNLVGSAQSVFATLTVTNNTQPPGILAQPTNLTMFVGQNATFGVTASGALPLHYQWYFNTNTVLAGKTNSTLTLPNVQLANAGWYSVTVTNLYGITNSAFATLTVNSNVDSQLIGWASVAGYGQATTTGGGTNAPILVSDIATLRTLAGDSTPRVLHISGTFVTGSSAITIGNNKTLRGVDANVVIQGGIDINTKSNIIIQNLSIQANGFGGSPVDAAAARTTHHLWFDHVTFSDAGDGLLDLTVGSDFITVSWCKFFYTDPNNTHRLCSLVGNGSTSTTDTNKNNVTYHHNWFSDLVDQRMPRLLFGKGHIFNNYYNAPGNGYCIGTGSWGSALVENNYFKQVKNPHQAQDGNPSYIAATGNVYDSCTGNTQTGLLNPDNDGNDPGPWTPPYSYTLATAASVPASVISGAGPQ